MKDRFIIKYNVNRNCQLKQYVNSVGLAFEKACTFYEFERQETISEDKELLFMHKVFDIISFFYFFYIKRLVHAGHREVLLLMFNAERTS